MQTPVTDEYNAGACGLDGEELTQSLAEENTALKAALKKERQKTRDQLIFLLGFVLLYGAVLAWELLRA